MRRFIEIIKEQTEAQVANGEPQEQIRVEVGWTTSDSTARLHICRHDDTPPAPCVLIPESEII